LKRFFPVSQPSIGEKEIAYVTDAVSSGWVSSIGKYIEEFERTFALFCGTRFAIATCNGTTALHLALVCVGVKEGDEIIVPDLTFIATANAARYAGASVVTVDIEAGSLCMDPAAVRRSITPKTKAIIPVHLYGHPANMEAIMAIAREHAIAVVEDAAEAHGAEFRGKKVGSIGDIGVFSFYGNKVVTAGEGGMLTTDSRELYDKARFLRDHAMSPERRYWHPEIGFNYRMTNLQAALAVAQMERIETFIAKRDEIMQWYRDELKSVPSLRLNREEHGSKRVYWMVCLEIAGLNDARRSELMKALRELGVDSRPYFYPISDMPMYSTASTPVAHRVSVEGINLPSYVDLTRNDVAEICGLLLKVLRTMRLI